MVIAGKHRIADSIMHVLKIDSGSKPLSKQKIRSVDARLASKGPCRILGEGNIFIDINSAYLCAKTDPEDPTYVELPKEHPWHKDGGSCALLLKHMCGTRKAGAGWHVEISATLTDKVGFTKGGGSA